jgi:hypothetical protein
VRPVRRHLVWDCHSIREGEGYPTLHNFEPPRLRGLIFEERLRPRRPISASHLFHHLKIGTSGGLLTNMLLRETGLETPFSEGSARPACSSYISYPANSFS